MDPRRRLAQAIRSGQTPNDAVQRTATVTAVHTDSGTLDMAVTTEGGGQVAVPGVRWIGALAPKVGQQVTYTLNGTEPVVIGVSGATHLPRVQAEVATAELNVSDGTNLLQGTFGSQGWTGWAIDGDATFVLAVGQAWINLGGASEVVLSSPFVDPIEFGVEHAYTGWVEVFDNAPGRRAWVELVALTDQGEVVLAGEEVALAGPNFEDGYLRRYPHPTPCADAPATTTGIGVRLRFPSGVSGTALIKQAAISSSSCLTNPWINAPRVQIGGGTLVTDGEDLMAPWTETVYDGTGSGYFELGGGNWVVRHRRVGKIAFVECVGEVESITAWPSPGNATALPLPYPPRNRAILHGYILDYGTRFYTAAAWADAGSDTIDRVLVNAATDGYLYGNNPIFTWANGDEVRLAGSYEVR